MGRIVKLKIGSNLVAGRVARVCLVKSPDRHGKVISKIILKVKADAGSCFHVDDAWVPDADGKPKSTGLWLKLDPNGLIRGNSALATVMTYYRAKTLRDLIGRAVMLCPKTKGYLAIVAADRVVNGSLSNARRPTE